MDNLEFHSLANIFPLLEGAEFEAAFPLEDFRLHGVREPIWTYEGKILEGRHRYRAAALAGVPCPTRPYEGDDPLAFVISMNLIRRHLDESQRAIVAARVATLRDGQRKSGSPNGEAQTQAEAAVLLNVGKRSVERARVVLDKGASDLVHAVERGVVSVSAAADVAGLPQSQQRVLVACGEKEILEAAAQIRATRAEARRTDRDGKLLALSRIDAPFPERRFPIILADAPYRYDHPLSVSREIENHYPTMATEEICALPVADLATPDAMLFLWTPVPLLITHALAIMQAWGFEYVTGAVWVKDKIGMGIYLRQQHELLLIGKRGTAIVPAPGNLSSSVIQAARTRHSEKPVEAYEMIERMYPTLPKIELFARGSREGWHVWGNEAPAQQRSA